MKPKISFINILRRTINGKKATIFLKNKTYAGSSSSKLSYVKAFHKGDQVGMLETVLSRGSAYLTDVDVHTKYRRLGLSSRMFKESLKNTRKAGYTSLKSDSIIHPAQIKIRDKYKTKFYKQDYQNPAGTTLISTKEAAEHVNVTHKIGSHQRQIISAETQIPSDINKYKRVRVRGRWLTIKRRK